VRRHQGLASLSRHHHRILSAAQELRRCTAATARQSRAGYLAHWESEGRNHIRLEEEVLLPAYACHGDPYDPLVARALCDHVSIRQRTTALLVDATPSPDALHQLGSLLAHHVRLEERELFPLIERTIPADQLAALADALEHDD